jgi:hypothetical protein
MTYLLWFFDGASHFLANIASSVIWLLATAILWVGLFDFGRYTSLDWMCRGQVLVSCTEPEQEAVVKERQHCQNVGSH